MKKYKGIIFDLDGTLLDTSEGIYNAIRYTESEMGFEPLDDSVLHEFVGPPSLDSYLNHFPIDRETALKAVAHHRHYQSGKGVTEARLYNGMQDLIAMLKETGHKLGVATLKRQDITEATLKAAAIDTYFDSIRGIDFQESLGKADLIRLVLDDFGLEPEACVMIGDSPYDAVGARDAGVPFIAAEYGFGFKNVQEINTYHPIYTAFFVDDLISFFDTE